MSNYIRCKKCGEFGIELIGDKELSCEYCEYLMSEETSM